MHWVFNLTIWVVERRSKTDAQHDWFNSVLTAFPSIPNHLVFDFYNRNPDIYERNVPSKSKMILGGHEYSSKLTFLFLNDDILAFVVWTETENVLIFK